jgi:HlyD family secretion protein
MKLAVDSQRYQRLRWLLGVTLLVIVAVPSLGWVVNRPKGSAAVASTSHSVTGLPITASGRIEPKDGVITIAAPTLDASVPIVAALHVRPGDWVHSGQMLATLSQHAVLEASLKAAERHVQISEAKLTALQAGGKRDDLNALRADVQSEEAQLAHVSSETQRAQQLREQRLISQSDLEAQQAKLAIVERTLDAKRAKLSGLSSVRPADVAVATAELAAANAAVDEVRAKLENSIVRAPSDGRVLEVHAYPGQHVGPQGVLAFGRTTEMFVDAEVMEADLNRAQVGQKVQITAEILPRPTTGVVEEIGYLVGTREVFNTDPTAFADSRIVHVKIRADEPQLLERFINARVTVAIEQ